MQQYNQDTIDSNVCNNESVHILISRKSPRSIYMESDKMLFSGMRPGVSKVDARKESGQERGEGQEKDHH